MVIDPVCALVFEAEHDEDDIMQLRPRDPSEALFSLPMIVWSIFQGGLAFAMLATVFLVETWSGMPELELRALILFALILFLPQAQTLLKFGSIAWSDMALAAGLGVVLLLLLEGGKPLIRRPKAGVSPTLGRGRVKSP
jgi:Ca2+-transporting ATPase